MAERDGVRIRPMVRADLEPAIAAIRDGGWGDRRLALEFYVGHSACHPLVAEMAGGIVGTSIATHSGRVGWLGLVFVAPAARGMGLGAALTRASLERVEGLGCRSVLLAATELGRPIYDRVGFVVDGGYAVWSGPGGGGLPDGSPVVRLRREDLAGAVELDGRVTGEDRGHAIRALADGWVIAHRGWVRGYALKTPWGLGPAIAEDPAEGALLVDVLLGQASAGAHTITVPTANTAAQRRLHERGFALQRELPRMRLGDPVDWQPTSIWAIFNFALG